MYRGRPAWWAGILAQIVVILACGAPSTAIPPPTASPATPSAVARVGRETKIPAGAVKMSPATDAHPPLSYSEDYENPVPVPGAVNTAGAEDSSFITADGQTLYFFFTPDVRVPVEKQLLDGVTGIYVSRRADGRWGQPERVVLEDPGTPSLDGCEFVLGERMWFCSTREGYTGIHWFTAEYQNGRWQNWKLADFNPDFGVGELHITRDGTELYFHSDRPGGRGQLDIWFSKNVNGEWQAPENVAAVNTPEAEGWPALSPDGNELWFYRNYAIWRSRKSGGQWQAPEQIFSPLAGEPSLDEAGNVYFVHHFFQDDQMIEADIYVAYKK